MFGEFQMTAAQYPNADALREGLDIYRDEMSEFVARVLRQKPGSRLDQTVANSLTDRQRQGFADNMRENDGDVPRSIEIGFIPNLVDRNWSDLFQRQFAKARTIRTILRTIRDIRNDVAHDTSGQDIPAEKAEANLYFISEALASINRPDQAQEVLNIRARIRIRNPAPVQQSQLEPTAPAVPQGGTAATSRATSHRASSGHWRHSNLNDAAAILAECGYSCSSPPIGMTAVDLIARRNDGTPSINVRCPGRLDIRKRQLGRGIHVVFPDQDGVWYLVPHDALVEIAERNTPWLDSPSWRVNGWYSSRSPSRRLRAALRSFALNST